MIKSLALESERERDWVRMGMGQKDGMGTRKDVLDGIDAPGPIDNQNGVCFDTVVQSIGYCFSRVIVEIRNQHHIGGEFIEFVY